MHRSQRAGVEHHAPLPEGPRGPRCRCRAAHADRGCGRNAPGSFGESMSPCTRRCAAAAATSRATGGCRGGGLLPADHHPPRAARPAGASTGAFGSARPLRRPGGRRRRAPQPGARPTARPDGLVPGEVSVRRFRRAGPFRIGGRAVRRSLRPHRAEPSDLPELPRTDITFLGHEEGGAVNRDDARGAAPPATRRGGLGGGGVHALRHPQLDPCGRAPALQLHDRRRARATSTSRCRSGSTPRASCST